MDGQGKCCPCYILIFQMPFLYMQLTHAYDNTFLELRFLKVFLAGVAFKDLPRVHGCPEDTWVVFNSRLKKLLSTQGNSLLAHLYLHFYSVIRNLPRVLMKY